MTQDFEYISYDDADRIAILENKAAELERRLLSVTPQGGGLRWGNVGTPEAGYQPGDSEDQQTAAEPEVFHEHATVFAGGDPAGTGYADGDDDTPPPDDRTEALIRHGRQRARKKPVRRFLAHWKLLAVGAAAVLAGIIAGLVLGGSGASWPSSVAGVQAEIKVACANQNVAAEPSGLNFACGTGTQQVLWAFSLLTSGNNAGYVDSSTGRKGLEPIQPAQGGDIAWSLNLHHPYNPANAVDSLQVAARAINNIIGGATLTSSTGAALVEPGLESKAANCQRYTGSAKLVTRQGYPATCAAPVSSGAGQAALVSDVFQQWMGGTPSTIASEAGVLFENSTDPGNAQVQAILNSLPASGG